MLQYTKCNLGDNPIIEVDTLSQAKPLSRVSHGHIKRANAIRPSCPQQNNISLELAIARILNASVEEISEVLKEVPPEKTGKLAIAIGQMWQEKSD